MKKYIAEVQDIILEIKHAIEHNEIDNVKHLCRGLKGTGAGYGFAAITEAAAQAVTALDSSLSIAESMTVLVRLESLGVRLRAGKPVVIEDQD